MSLLTTVTLENAPLIDKIKAYIVLGFSILVALAFLASLGVMIYLKITEPGIDIGIWLNLFLTCLGYIVGILTGLLGIPAPQPGADDQP